MPLTQPLSARKTFQNLTGQRFGKLLVESYAGLLPFKNQRWACWNCLCDCGRRKVIMGTNLRGGRSTSCGCMSKPRGRFRTHGRARTPEYRTWGRMIQRCTNKNATGFALYGGRGITVCDRWLNSFEAFFEDMGLKPSPEHSIDRIDTNGNYEPGNCRWATMKEQSRNKREHCLYTLGDETLCQSAWAERLGISREALRQRLLSGWPLDVALTTPKPA